VDSEAAYWPRMVAAHRIQLRKRISIHDDEKYEQPVLEWAAKKKAGEGRQKGPNFPGGLKKTSGLALEKDREGVSSRKVGGGGSRKEGINPGPTGKLV